MNVGKLGFYGSLENHQFGFVSSNDEQCRVVYDAVEFSVVLSCRVLMRGTVQYTAVHYNKEMHCIVCIIMALV